MVGGHDASPRFSIVVPAYQAEATLAETVEAILAQTWSSWECIVVDDGSSDATFAIAQGFARKDPRVHVAHQVNTGTAGAYNTGVTMASGKYVVICSADDILLPTHLATMSAFIDAEQEYDIYSSNGYFWEPGLSRELVYAAESGATVHSLELADVIRRCFYSVGATYRRELFSTIGGYRVGIYGEDYDFWLRGMASGARHRYLPEALSLHRISQTQKSAALEKVFRSDIRLVSDLRQSFSLSPEEQLAVEEAIRDREWLIAEVTRRKGLLHAAARRLAYELLGPRRAQRVARRMRSLAGR